MEVLARTGYAARGVVYLIVGFFAVLAAFGRSEVKGTKGALQELLSQPFGQILVGLMAIGLAAFFCWRVAQAIRDPDDHGTDAKGVILRLALAFSGLSYAALALLAVAMATGFSSGSVQNGGDPTGGWLAAVYQTGFAWLLLYGITTGFFAVGVAHIVKAVRADFDKTFDCSEEVLRWLRPLCRFGIIARGAVFLIIGSLIVSGGLAYDVDKKPGLSDALRAVQGFTLGWLLLLIIALGLLAFGIYGLAEACFRRVTPNTSR